MFVSIKSSRRFMLLIATVTISSILLWFLSCFVELGVSFVYLPTVRNPMTIERSGMVGFELGRIWFNYALSYGPFSSRRRQLSFHGSAKWVDQFARDHQGPWSYSFHHMRNHFRFSVAGLYLGQDDEISHGGLKTVDLALPIWLVSSISFCIVFVLLRRVRKSRETRAFEMGMKLGRS